MADTTAFNRKVKLYNRLVIMAVVLSVLIVPLYLGMGAAFVLYYGEAYIEAIYQPQYLIEQYVSLFQYTTYYFDQLPDDFRMKMLGPPAGGVLLSLFILFLLRAPLMDFRPFKEKESVHGDAHWATEPEIKKAKLRSKKGVLLGRTGKSNYLVADDFQHILLFAPTGSGKGVGFVIPNLLFWENSVVVHDIKGENHELCSGYRKKLGQEVYYWNPADPDGLSHCYNPLDWISEKPGQMVDDVQKICKDRKSVV